RIQHRAEALDAHSRRQLDLRRSDPIELHHDRLSLAAAPLGLTAAELDDLPRGARDHVAHRLTGQAFAVEPRDGGLGGDSGQAETADVALELRFGGERLRLHDGAGDDGGTQRGDHESSDSHADILTARARSETISAP